MRELGSEGAEERRSGGAGEQESKGGGERGSGGAGEVGGFVGLWKAGGAERGFRKVCEKSEKSFLVSLKALSVKALGL